VGKFVPDCGNESCQLCHFTLQVSASAASRFSAAAVPTTKRKFKVYTLPRASSLPSARCRRRRKAALFEPRHNASGSVLLKVVAALFDNLKFVLSPSYVPSRKFKEAAQTACAVCAMLQPNLNVPTGAAPALARSEVRAGSRTYGGTIMQHEILSSLRKFHVVALGSAPRTSQSAWCT